MDSVWIVYQNTNLVSIPTLNRGCYDFVGLSRGGPRQNSGPALGVKSDCVVFLQRGLPTLLEKQAIGRGGWKHCFA